ncbi:MAG: hypothetical protein ABIP44_05165 [Pseudoxanthomonas sp.]
MQQSPDPNIIANSYVHVRILLGMIVGLGLTHLLRHLARIIEHPAQRRVYWVHLLWALFVFLFLLHFWWWEFSLSHQPHWSFNLYLFVTVYALLLYLLCALVFPESLEGFDGYRDYFYSRRRWFFGLLALSFLVDLIDTLIKGSEYLHRLGPEYLWRNAVFFVACLIAMASRNTLYHRGFAVAALLYELTFIARHYEAMPR